MLPSSKITCRARARPADLGSVVALYDFAPNSSEELTFQQGDEFQVLQRIDEAWILVRRESDGAQGYVPTTYMRALSGTGSAQDGADEEYADVGGEDDEEDVDNGVCVESSNVFVECMCA
eukprot:m.953164 g.953164  ORF g.953164 m.953164 type:complete len:120 (+) comp23870_c0_seq5:1268-1627(+)